MGDGGVTRHRFTEELIIGILKADQPIQNLATPATTLSLIPHAKALGGLFRCRRSEFPFDLAALVLAIERIGVLEVVDDLFRAILTVGRPDPPRPPEFGEAVRGCPERLGRNLSAGPEWRHDGERGLSRSSRSG